MICVNCTGYMGNCDGYVCMGVPAAWVVREKSYVPPERVTKGSF